MLDLIKNHEKNIDFQQKALTLLQSLTGSSEDFCTTLLPVIKKIMKSTKSEELLHRCCEIVYDFARNDHETSVQLIKRRVSRIIFKILRNSNDDALQNIAADCIYMLALEHDLKNLMLRKMCAVGDTDAVNLLLQLSADVNNTEADESPLSLACKTNNLDLVKLLLAHGVSDLHHPLTICLENDDRRRLAGLILKCMGHDEAAGTISLTGWSK